MKIFAPYRKFHELSLLIPINFTSTWEALKHTNNQFLLLSYWGGAEGGRVAFEKLLGGEGKDMRMLLLLVSRHFP